MGAAMPNILVVGNFPTNSLTGHQVQTASGYDEAIEILKTEDFDVIIMDAVIDTTAGHAFISHIRDHKVTPTIVRYQHPHVFIPTVAKMWQILPSIEACFPFARHAQMGRGENKRVQTLVAALLRQRLAA
jgi:Response regulator receiver domain